MNTVYHTSPEAITEITMNGLFDDCLFFSTDIYSMGDIVATYEMEVECLETSSFFYQDNCDEILKDVVSTVAMYFDCDNDTAIDLLDDTKRAFFYMCENGNNENGEAGEAAWYIQKKQGEAGKLLGYDGAISDDEQGTVYIIPMMGRENDLKEVK